MMMVRIVSYYRCPGVVPIFNTIKKLQSMIVYWLPVYKHLTVAAAAGVKVLNVCAHLLFWNSAFTPERRLWNKSLVTIDITVSVLPSLHTVARYVIQLEAKRDIHTANSFNSIWLFISLCVICYTPRSFYKWEHQKILKNIKEWEQWVITANIYERA